MGSCYTCYRPSCTCCTTMLSTDNRSRGFWAYNCKKKGTLPTRTEPLLLCVETVSIQWGPCDLSPSAASHHQILQGLLYWPMLHWVLSDLQCNNNSEMPNPGITSSNKFWYWYNQSSHQHHSFPHPHFVFLFLVFAAISLNRMLALLLAARLLGLNKYIANNIPGSW